ncbi:MAG: nickel pincer cofactor biosynthesis protein LarB [Acidimicrobiales bacterium]
MDELELRRLIDDLRTGAIGPDDAVARLHRLPFAELGYAKVDHHRALRQGRTEAVYAPGKTPDQCAGIVAELLAESSCPVLVTRADEAQAHACAAQCPGGEQSPATFRDRRLATLTWRPAEARPGRILVCTAGTSDLPVADECLATLRAYGYRPTLLADCGVAGVHRILVSVDDLIDADAVVVIAGMEGALASVVGGLTAAPVVAVPTSVGYGAALEGVTALLAMLSSCAAGVSVVGIDNGYGAASAVARLLR